jgi:hypothetical protein
MKLGNADLICDPAGGAQTRVLIPRQDVRMAMLFIAHEGLANGT